MKLPMPMVGTAWVEENLREGNLKVVDGSWYLPTSGRDPKQEFLERHVPGAVFFDIDACCDTESSLPHMLPGPAQFARYAETLGIDSDSSVVIYDGSGVNLSAARVWWTFRYFGHEKCAVLDGGWPAWASEGRPVESGAVEPPSRSATFRADPRPEMVRDADQVLGALESGNQLVVDTRPPGRFEGTAPEPRAGLRGGHMPGSRNVHYRTLVHPDRGTLRSPQELGQILSEAGVDLVRPIIATCGSGTSACALVLALASVGKDDVSVYDGSWSEWGGRPELPVVRGTVD